MHPIHNQALSLARSGLSMGCLGAPRSRKKRAACCGPGESMERSHHALGRTVVVVRHAVLVFDHLTIEFIHQIVHRGVKVFMSAFSKQVIAFDVDVALCALPP
jgi:hypothetical protein